MHSSSGPPRRLSDRRSCGSALSDERPRPKRAEGAPIFRLTLGDYRGRSFANRVFADRSFADGPLTNWRGLDNRLRAREVRSDRRSRQSQRRSTNDYEFQHEVPLLRLKTTRIVDLYDHYGAINRCLSKRAIFFTNVAETARLN